MIIPLCRVCNVCTKLHLCNSRSMYRDKITKKHPFKFSEREWIVLKQKVKVFRDGLFGQKYPLINTIVTSKYYLQSSLSKQCTWAYSIYTTQLQTLKQQKMTRKFYLTNKIYYISCLYECAAVFLLTKGWVVFLVELKC